MGLQAEKSMRVLLVSANREQINMPALPWGLGCVAMACLDAGHQVSMVDLMAVDDPRGAIEGAIKGGHPDVIGISVRNIDDQGILQRRFLLEQAKEAVDLCRALTDAPIVVGGAGYSIFPLEALRYLGADMGIQGEGEAAFVELLERLRRGEPLEGLHGLHLRDGGHVGQRRCIQDLDRFHQPLPDLWAGLEPSMEDLWVPMQTRRGCPMNCIYCSTPLIEGARTRFRSPQQVIRTLTRWVEAGFQRFFFVDNTFNLPPSYAGTLCDAIIRSGLEVQLRGIIYPLGLDEELVEKMARAGFREVSIGTEHASPQVLKALGKRFGPEEIRRTCDLFSRHGIRRMGFLLLGGPGETRESVLEALRFIESLGLEAVRVTPGIRIYPATPLHKMALQEGIISEVDDLLFPTFYVARGLEEWLPQTAVEWACRHPNWMV